jgi:hypothetical protein
MNKIVKGSTAELIACTYFLQKNYYVFKSLNMISPFDLIVHKESISYHVIVKTLTITDSRSPTVGIPRNSQWDLLAVVNIDENRTHIFEAKYSIDEIRSQLFRIYQRSTSRIMPCNKRVSYVRDHLKNCEVCVELAKSKGIWDIIESMNNLEKEV